MSFDDDAARWDEMITGLNLLSVYRYSGYLNLYFVDGRLDRGSVRRVSRLVEMVKKAHQHEETVHA